MRFCRVHPGTRDTHACLAIRDLSRSLHILAVPQDVNTLLRASSGCITGEPGKFLLVGRDWWSTGNSLNAALTKTYQLLMPSDDELKDNCPVSQSELKSATWISVTKQHCRESFCQPKAGGIYPFWQQDILMVMNL